MKGNKTFSLAKLTHEKKTKQSHSSKNHVFFTFSQLLKLKCSTLGHYNLCSKLLKNKDI